MRTFLLRLRAAAWLPVFLLGFLAVALSACEKTEEDNTDYAARDEATIQTYITDNKLTGFQRQASGLYVGITQPGSGAQAKTDQVVLTRYKATLLDGTVFDSNMTTLGSFEFVLGKGKNAGWDEGFALLNKGAKATFLVPSPLAYGPLSSNIVPPHSIIRYDVEVMDIIDIPARDEASIQAYIAANNLTGFQRQPSGLYVAITQAGTGDNAKKNQTVAARYTGTTLDGKVFDSNATAATPFSFTVGAGQVIAGWDEGFLLLNKGSKAILLIPSGLAYGSRAVSTIPANSVLRFDVEVADIK
ncbi:FKBP-type peptidyl-prolyl cis-trans isomerase [Hymenobacter sp. DG01]|uniref:FKBP-type peptidyl-prolyl cis-trans isomerase n=1 Tax=Hymenobacter sp. DG01 TaxID=2584940 RepID=UPI001121A2CA|nr:FKBP-type peptidyl-prolyl cis-trans isomerase [Hymenobacter sp. DG01]